MEATLKSLHMNRYLPDIIVLLTNSLIVIENASCVTRLCRPVYTENNRIVKSVIGEIYILH